MKRQGLESACGPNLTTRRGRLAGGSLESPAPPSLVFSAAIVRRSRFTPYQLGVRIDGRLLAGPGESWPPAPRWFAGESRRNAGYRPSYHRLLAGESGVGKSSGCYAAPTEPRRGTGFRHLDSTAFPRDEVVPKVVPDTPPTSEETLSKSARSDASPAAGVADNSSRHDIRVMDRWLFDGWRLESPAALQSCTELHRFSASSLGISLALPRRNTIGERSRSN